MAKSELDIFDVGPREYFEEARLTGHIGLSDDDANGVFTERMNEGVLSPIAFDMSKASTLGEMMIVGQEAEIIPSGVRILSRQLHKLFDRFTPGHGAVGSEAYRSEFTRFLKDRGIEISSESDEILEKELETHLRNGGSVVYFPRGVNRNGRLVVDQLRYLPEELEREMLSASAWKLIPEATRQSIAHSVLVSPGLSVGSEILLDYLDNGVTRFVLGDPGTLHLDLEGRLGRGFDRRYLGINKTHFMIRQIIEKFPYAGISFFAEGLTEANAAQMIHAGLLSQTKIAKGGRLYIAEETDTRDGKVLSRQRAHELPKGYPWDLIMIADVEHRAIFQSEAEGDKPFHGMMEKVDPQGDVFGRNIPEAMNFLFIVASVGGFSGVPMGLLQMIKNGEIGDKKGARITRAPQMKGATLTAASAADAALRQRASGGKLAKYAVIDVGQKVDEDWMANEAGRSLEEQLQRAMNMQVFNTDNLIDG